MAGIPNNIVLTTISQVMQVFPEPALETFEIEESKIQGYILHESDIIRGTINYDYWMAQHNFIELSLNSFADATGFTDFIWNPAGDNIKTPTFPLVDGRDFVIDWTTRTLTLKPSWELMAVERWNSLQGSMQERPVQTVAVIGVPVEFTIVGGALNGQRKQGYFYDSGNFNDAAQQLFLNSGGVDPFIQRLCALLVVLDIIKFWIKPLYMIDESSNIVGTAFSENDSLPGWDHMQKRLENAIAEMWNVIGKWGVKKGRVGNGSGMNPENPDLMRSLYVATAVRGATSGSPTEYSPFMGWDDPFLFERPDRGNALGDTLFGYTGRGQSSW